jgi:hypothetical protein
MGMKKPKNQIAPEHASEVVAAYQGGSSLQILASQYDVTGPTVAKYLRKQGIVLRTRSELNRQRAPVDECQLRRLVDEALTLPTIAQRLGVSEATVERRMRALGLRSKHGRGSPMEKNYFWKGGRNIDSDGYVLIKKSGHPYATKAGYVREHRLVMERELGRYLEPHEIVHHRKTAEKSNNHPDNLLLYADNHEHFLHEHADHPRDPKTGRFLRMPRNLLPEDPE